MPQRRRTAHAIVIAPPAGVHHTVRRRKVGRNIYGYVRPITGTAEGIAKGIDGIIDNVPLIGQLGKMLGLGRRRRAPAVRRRRPAGRGLKRAGDGKKKIHIIRL